MNAITPAAVGSEAAQAGVLALAEGWRAPANADAFADHFQRWFDPQIRLIEPSLPILVGNEAFRERFAGRCSHSSRTCAGRWNALPLALIVPTSR